MKDFEYVINQLERNQRNYYILTAVGASLLVSLWFLNLFIPQIKSDRPSLPTVQSNRLYITPSQKDES